MTTLGPGGMVAVLGVGMVAGAVNTVVGSGSLLTFPTLLALGYPALTANVTNTIGLVAGSASGAVGYREELAGQRGRLTDLAVPAAIGGLSGGGLLLVLPAGVFTKVVPVLVALACLLVGGQPWLATRLGRRDAKLGRERGAVSMGARAGVFAIAVYGGYFGAAIGVLLIGVLGLLLADSLQRVNAAKNVLAAVVNGVASVLFAIFAPVAWLPAGMLAAGSLLGGQVGARYGRRLSPRALRAGVVVVGLGVSVRLFLQAY
jgi:uncharacterized membrane protein YfcA